MKRLLLICFLIFGLSSSVSAISLIGSGISGAACNTVINQTTQNDSMSLGSDPNGYNQWGAQVFTSDGIYTAKTFYVMLAVNRTGDMAGQTVTASLCTTSAGHATETCTNADETLDATTLTTTPTAYKFNIAAGYSLTAADFAVRLYQSKGDYGDYVLFYYYGTGSKNMDYDDTPPDSWTTKDSTATAYIVVKDCVE